MMLVGLNKREAMSKQLTTIGWQLKDVLIKLNLHTALHAQEEKQ